MSTRRLTMREPARLALVLLALASSACPDTQSGHAPKICGQAYDKCELPNGVLGVCDVVECTDGQPGPCLACRSQH